MVVNIDKSKRHPNYAWVSFANLEGGNFIKRWTDLLKNEQIKYGTIGEFDENREFHSTQQYFDLKQRYSVGQVISVEQGDYYYKYHVGLANDEFDTSFVDSRTQQATVGNKLLLLYDKYKMNLTTMENCWDLLNHYNMGKYGLRPSYRGFVANKYCPIAANKEYTNSKGELVMPVVVSGYYGDNLFRVFKPENRWHNINIVVSGKWRPLPRPSDVVLLEQTEDEDKFILADNLTMSAELRNMQNKFGLPQHQAAMAEYYQKCFGERG